MKTTKVRTHHISTRLVGLCQNLLNDPAMPRRGRRKKPEGEMKSEEDEDREKEIHREHLKKQHQPLFPSPGTIAKGRFLRLS